MEYFLRLVSQDVASMAAIQQVRGIKPTGMERLRRPNHPPLPHASVRNQMPRLVPDPKLDDIARKLPPS